MLITVKLKDGFPSLRKNPQAQLVKHAVERGAEREGFRICEYSIQMNHLHLMAEADSAEGLRRGMIGLGRRVSIALNRSLGRQGGVFQDRFHHLALGTPREVRNGLAYVLHNCHKHGDPLVGPDPLSSGWEFEGWDRRLREAIPRSLPRARTWLLRTGWIDHWGPIPVLDPPLYRTPRAPSRT